MTRLKLGRLPARRDDRTLRLAAYLPPHLPAPPPTADRLAAVAAWPMLLNDQLGDCTIASASHLELAWNAAAGHPTSITDQDVLAAYELASGYIPGRPETDNGAVMLDVLNLWRQSGIAGHRIGAYVAVNPHNPVEVRQAITLFGGLYVGVTLPDASLSSSQIGHTWRLVPGPSGKPNPANGHAVMVGAYSPASLGAVTWGMRQRITQGWWNRCVEEAWAIVALDKFNATGRSITGLDLAALTADLKAVAA